VPGSPGAKFSRFHPALVIRSRSPSSKPVQNHFPDEASRRSDGVTGWVEACNGALMKRPSASAARRDRLLDKVVVLRRRSLFGLFSRLSRHIP